MASLKIKKKKPSLRANLIGFTLLALCVGVLFITSAGTLSRESIEAQLQKLAGVVSKQAADNGKDGSLSWGEITIDGWGYDKVGTVRNLLVSINDKGAVDGTNKWTISTAASTVPPQHDESVTSFVFPEPFNVMLNGELKSTLTFSAPAKYDYTATPGGAISHAWSLPEQLVITPAKTATDKAPKAPRYIVAFDANPVIRSSYNGGEHDVIMNFHNFKISTDEGDLAAVTSLSSNYKETQQPDQTVRGSYKLGMSDLLIRQPNGMMKPYSFDAALSFVTHPAQTVTDENGVTMTVRGAADVTIESLNLLTNEFGLNVKGTVSAAADDPLLFGEATIEITNAGNFLASPLLPGEMRPMAEIALQKITGGAINATSNISIPLKREKNGVFMLGGITFEELAAAVFAEMLKNQPTVTSLPSGQPAAAPGAAPVSPVVSGPAGDLPEPTASEGQ